MSRFGLTKLHQRLTSSSKVEARPVQHTVRPSPPPFQSALPEPIDMSAKVGTQADPREFRDGFEPKANDVFVAIMGVTGAGKSTFISLCTDKEVRIGHSLQACTQEVSVFLCEYSKDVNVYLIDTPGFDDTDRSDAAILKEIAAWLTASYAISIKLHGIIYLHRITDPRMQGSAKRNLFMFKKLCGVDALKNVILATTMWDGIDKDAGAERERQLRETPDFWGWMIENGSQIHRHQNERDSAIRLIGDLIDGRSENKRVVLDIQAQMVDDGRNLAETAAGLALDDAIAQERSKFAKELAEMQAEMREALATRDNQAADMLAMHQAEMNEKVQRLDDEHSQLKVSLTKLQEERFEKMKTALENAEHENRRTREALEATKLEQDRRQAALEEQLKESHLKAQQAAEAAHKREVDELQEKLKQLSAAPSKIIKPRTRSHPNMTNTMELWGVSTTLWAGRYFFVAHTADRWGDVPPEFPAARTLETGSGNWTVAYGDQESYYIHHHDGNMCYTTRSENFSTVYKPLEDWMVTNQQFGCPSCVSLGPEGTFFLRSNKGCIWNIPDDAADYLNTNGFTRGIDFVQSLWLGKDQAWVACRMSGELIWNLRGHYAGLADHIKNGIKGEKRIKTIAMDPVDPNQWVIVWKNGLAAYNTGELHPFDSFEFEDWCTLNFGTIWN